MTKNEKLQQETKLISEFMWDGFMTSYYNHENLDRVITSIQNLNYSFSLLSVATRKGYKHVTGFSNNNVPFNNIHIISEKSRLDAMYELVLKFIKEKDEQRQEKDN